MDSLTFRPGNGRLVSSSSNPRWMLVFEDEGPAGYCYACDAQAGSGEDGIVDSMLVYNVSSLDGPARERLASVQWSRSGQQAVLYFDGVPQALLDFSTRRSFCRSNFPNFVEQPADTWRRHSHAWDEAAITGFESDLYQ